MTRLIIFRFITSWIAQQPRHGIYLKYKDKEFEGKSRGSLNLATIALVLDMLLNLKDEASFLEPFEVLAYIHIFTLTSPYNYIYS